MNITSSVRRLADDAHELGLMQLSDALHDAAREQESRDIAEGVFATQKLKLVQ
jgi:hypothetical protein